MTGPSLFGAIAEFRERVRRVDDPTAAQQVMQSVARAYRLADDVDRLAFRASAVTAIAARAEELGVEHWPHGDVIEALEPLPLAPTAEPLRFPGESSAGRFLDSDPPPVEYLVDDVVTLRASGANAGAGGVMKSMGMLQLGLSVATRTRWLGHDVSKQGAALIVCTEDDEGEAHRRIDRILQHPSYAGVDPLMVREYLHVIPMVGMRALLTQSAPDSVYPLQTAFVDRLIATAEQYVDVRLIVLDNMSRMRGGNPNSEEAVLFSPHPDPSGLT